MNEFTCKTMEFEITAECSGEKNIQKQEDREDATHILSQFLQLPQKMRRHVLGKENMKIWCRGATLHR